MLKASPRFKHGASHEFRFGYPSRNYFLTLAKLEYIYIYILELQIVESRTSFLEMPKSSFAARLKEHQFYVLLTPYTVDTRSSQLPILYNSLSLKTPLLAPNTLLKVHLIPSIFHKDFKSIVGVVIYQNIKGKLRIEISVAMSKSQFLSKITIRSFQVQSFVQHSNIDFHPKNTGPLVLCCAKRKLEMKIEMKMGSSPLECCIQTQDRWMIIT